METLIEINHISKIFMSENSREVNALEDINLRIGAEEFVCILGPSGSGKSTLLRLVSGLIEPTSGNIRVLDHVLKKPIREAGMVFQEYSLLPWRTIVENVSFGLKLRGYSLQERSRSGKEILAKFGLEGFENSYPYELSGGMQQRAAIARAIAVSPKLLYMDEPFGALDAYTRLRMQKELLQFWEKEKRTIVFVTHSIEEAVFLGTRVIVMSKRPGKIIEDIEINLPENRSRFDSAFALYFNHLMDLMNKVSEE